MTYFGIHPDALDLDYHVISWQCSLEILLYKVNRINLARLPYTQLTAHSGLQRHIDSLSHLLELEQRIERLFRLPANRMNYASFLSKHQV